MNAPKNRSPISQFRSLQEVRPPTSDYLRPVDEGAVSVPRLAGVPNPMRFGNFDDRSQGAVPEGQTRIAQRFSVGSVTKRAQVPKGRLILAGQESNSAVPS